MRFIPLWAVFIVLLFPSIVHAQAVKWECGRPQSGAQVIDEERLTSGSGSGIDPRTIYEFCVTSDFSQYAYIQAQSSGEVDFVVNGDAAPQAFPAGLTGPVPVTANGQTYTLTQVGGGTPMTSYWIIG